MGMGATHRSRAAGVKPSWPFPAMPLLEHAASGNELLGGVRTGGTLHVRPDAPNRTESNECAALYSREWTAKRPSGSEPGPKPRLPPPHFPTAPQESCLHNCLLLWTELLSQTPMWEP